MLTLFIIFCVAAALQLFYYLWFYLAPALSRDDKGKSSDKPVSVIICARNEADNLRKFLPSVLGQDYPSFEVIVVNDCSEDATDDLLGEMIVKYPNLRISSINKDPKFTHSKKFAQFIGIKAAENELLLFTDADCMPDSPQWIRRMVSGFTDSTDFVLGYGGFMREKGILNSYIRYDTLFIAMQYLGMAMRGVPYMGVGRNLAWRKSVFFINKGFGAHNHIASGDDDLFVNANATDATTRVEFNPEAHTRSVAASSVESWIKQKHRHLTTAAYYKLRDKLLLILEPLSRVIFYALFIVLISFLFMWPYILGVFGLRLIIQIIILYLISKRLNEKDNVIPCIIYDFFSPLINISLYLSTFRNRGGNTKWK
jgi:cellulose synthase/poly-beta-1,6-N-acetylglucosamine synthase-like glycosyltransferase